ncbi:hypothetical protein CFI11_00325 [Thalassococcus sp. S3]|nr:hypothetical protein CFI11_00325 [Thalassococcus sp. S3]
MRLLASGALPHRPRRRPCAQAASDRLNAWRRMQGLQSDIVIEEASFADDLEDVALHAAGLRDDWKTVCGRVPAPMLVYLHRGHQPDPRSPILQHLLRTIDHRGPVHALRVETRRALHDALDLARGLAAQAGLALVLSDPTERLATRAPNRAPLRFLLLGDARLAEHHIPASPHPSVPDFIIQESP